MVGLPAGGGSGHGPRRSGAGGLQSWAERAWAGGIGVFLVRSHRHGPQQTPQTLFYRRSFVNATSASARSVRSGRVVTRVGSLPGASPLDAAKRMRINPGTMTILGGFGGRGRGTGPGGDAPASKGTVPYVTERDFESEVLRSELPVLIEFTADWCQPCKAIAPEVEAFARESAGKAKVVKIDIDKSPVIAQQLRIQSVPTFMVVAEGRIQDAVVGAIRKKKMQELVEPFLPRAAGALKAPELAQLLSGGAVVPIDTRDEGAFKRAHLPRAVNMPIEGIESRLAELHMLPGQPVLYCRSGDKTKELARSSPSRACPSLFSRAGCSPGKRTGLPIERVR